MQNYLFLGDLNSMGMTYPYNRDIPVETELRKWDSYASQYYRMRRLTKTHNATWSNGSGSRYPDSNLDHVAPSRCNMALGICIIITGGSETLEEDESFAYFDIDGDDLYIDPDSVIWDEYGVVPITDTLEVPSAISS